jgi:hypothetical protein
VSSDALVTESVESLLDRWKREFQHGSFTYADPATSFRRQVADHFGRAVGRVYGVYLIRRQHDQSILYIGKGGTIGGDGQFKGQDVPGRLRNVRGGDIAADQWFRELLSEAGPVAIEYVVLTLPITPAYVEVSLLQAYLAEYGRLPPKNREL